MKERPPIRVTLKGRPGRKVEEGVKEKAGARPQGSASACAAHRLGGHRAKNGEHKVLMAALGELCLSGPAVEGSH